MTERALARPAGPRVPQYTTQWLNRYESLTASDMAIVDSEMAAVHRWFERRYPVPGRSLVRHLDVGTCTGRYLRWGIRQGFSLVCGVDSSPDAVAFCSQLFGPGRVPLYLGDFMRESTLPELVARHGRFPLITMMMGTINHVRRNRHRAVIGSLAEALTPTGRLLISSWQPGRCGLSLYDEEERRFLESTQIDVEEFGRPTEMSDPVLIERIRTDWHVILVFARADASVHPTGTDVLVPGEGVEPPRAEAHP